MSTPATPTLRGARRAMVVAVVVALVAAAALGIVALLSGEFSEQDYRILLTTLVVAAAGTTALCHLAVVALPVRAVGVAGLLASAGAAALALGLVWELAPTDGAAPWRTLGVLSVLAVGFAHANLLLLLVRHRHTAVRVGLVLTLVMIAAVAAMVIALVLGAEPEDGPFFTWLGVLGILDALGTIALPVLGLVLRRPVDDPSAITAPATSTEPDGPSGTTDGARLTLDVPADLLAALDHLRGAASREQAALTVLRRQLTPAHHPTR